MGGLAHYLEDEGLATTQISLVREQTEIIKPPRALWVPFELGRPLGAPNDKAFQTRVIMDALNLLEAPKGPVLADFEGQAPFEVRGDSGTLACPVSFEIPDVQDEKTKLIQTFEQEVAQLRTWYDQAVQKRERTTALATGLEPEVTARFLVAFLGNEGPENPVPDVPFGLALKMAVEDVKAYYIEAVSAQPGQPSDSRTLEEWFWNETRAAQVIHNVRATCMNSEDDLLKRFGKNLLVPRIRVQNPANNH